MTDQKPTNPGPLFRALAVLGGGLVFVLIASVIHPGSSTAISEPVPTVPANTTSLGSLVSGEYAIEFVAASPNALYTVKNAAGTILLENATAEELYRLDPEHLDVSRFVATMSDIDTADY